MNILVGIGLSAIAFLILLIGMSVSAEGMRNEFRGCMKVNLTLDQCAVVMGVK